jgi:hypothetical protein
MSLRARARYASYVELMKRLALVLLVACGGSKSDDPPAAPPPPVVAPRNPTIPNVRPRPTPGSDGTPLADPVDHHDRTAPAARAERRKERVEQMAQRLDLDGDGKLTVDELSKADGRMKFDDPAAVDTDHDGVISADELQAAMAARRGGHRHQRADGAGSDTGSAQGQ